MNYVINGFKVNCCARCQCDNVLVSYPILVCKNCHAIFVFDTNKSNNGPIEAKFPLEDYYIHIMYLEQKTYVGDYKLDMAVPLDISAQKLKTYLVFS